MKKMNLYVATKLATFAFLTSLAGCSDESGSPVTGGTAEETGILALDNISIAGRVQFYMTATTDDSAMVPQVKKANSQLLENAKFYVYELDGKTMDTTGAKAAGEPLQDGGSFAVDSLSFKSRYAMLAVSTEVEDNDFMHIDRTGSSGGKLSGWFYSVVDLAQAGGKTVSANVNILTHLASGRIRNLVASGETFDNALAQAEHEVLGVMGIYGSYKPFAEMVADSVSGDAPLVAANYLMTPQVLKDSAGAIVEDIAENGAWDDSLAKSRIMEYLFDVDPGYYFHADMRKRFRSIFYYCPFGEDISKYVYAFPAKEYGLGECTAAREGEVYVFAEVSRNALVCEDGFWMFRDPYEYMTDIPHTMGTMTDSRDGKTYKTVTYAAAGFEQVWMAENLNYAADSSYCSNNDETLCAKYGRLYRWNTAVGIDGDYETLDFSVVLGQLGEGSRQGVCPNGWHIPAASEWIALFSYLDSLTFQWKDVYKTYDVNTEEGRTFSTMEPIDPLQASFARVTPFLEAKDSALSNEKAYHFTLSDGTNASGFDVKELGEEDMANTETSPYPEYEAVFAVRTASTPVDSGYVAGDYTGLRFPLQGLMTNEYMSVRCIRD